MSEVIRWLFASAVQAVTMVTAGQVPTVDAPARTVRGLIVPFGQLGRASSGPTVIHAGSVAIPEDVSRVKLFRDHRRADGSGDVVGHCTGIEQTDQGLVASFSIVDGPAGDQALIDARAVRDGLSVELTDVDMDGSTLRAGALAAVALVPVPAFADARVQSVHANASVGHVGPASAPPMSRSATFTRERPSLSLSSVCDTLAGVAGGQRSELLTAALADITRTAHPWVSQTGWLGELWSGLAYQRQYVPLLNSAKLTNWQIQGWRWVVKPVVDTYAGDKAEIPTNLPTTESVTASAIRLAGGHDIDRKFIDFPDSAFVESYFRAMTESYAVESDAYALDAITGAATAAGSAATVLDAVAAAKFAVKADSRADATFVLLSDADYLSLLSVGQFDLPAFMGALKIDPSNWTSSPDLPAGTVYVGARQAISFYELPGSPIRVQAEHLANGGRDAALFGYVSHIVHDARAVKKVTVTPPPVEG